MSNIPKHLKYTVTHEWVRDEGNGIYTMGITDHAQHLLGDVVYVQLPELSKKVKKGEEFGVVESVKAAADIYSPIEGEVVAINDELTSKPELINNDPYNEGWFCQVRISDQSSLAELLLPEDYAGSIE